MDNCPKTVDGLMRYLRNEKGILINGSVQKRKLRNIGYYHGYKGYRYITVPTNKVPYTDFNEILAVNAFDMKLKALIYPQIMFLETALKNYVLEVVIADAKSDSFNNIYANLLDNYKSLSTKGRTFSTNGEKHKAQQKYKEAVKKRLTLRNTVYSTLTRDYTYDNKIVKHFYHKDMNVPIWAIFERISLGDFGSFVSNLSLTERKKISKNIGLDQGFDVDGELTQKIIYSIKDLRNSVAHNDIIFDTRFKRGEVGNPVMQCVQTNTKVSRIQFTNIVDYIVLITYLLKILEVSKTEMNRFVSDFEAIVEVFRKQVPPQIFSKIIYTDINLKITSMKAYIKIK